MPTVLLEPKSMQYTLQNFSTSTYAKLNGTPWTVNHDKAINDELVVGMGLAELSGRRSPHLGYRDHIHVLAHVEPRSRTDRFSGLAFHRAEEKG